MPKATLLHYPYHRTSCCPVPGLTLSHAYATSSLRWQGLPWEDNLAARPVLWLKVCIQRWLDVVLWCRLPSHGAEGDGPLLGGGPPQHSPQLDQGVQQVAAPSEHGRLCRRYQVTRGECQTLHTLNTMSFIHTGSASSCTQHDSNICLPSSRCPYTMKTHNKQLRFTTTWT